MDAFLYLIAWIGGILIAINWIVHNLPYNCTQIFDYQKGLVYENGHFTKMITSGIYWFPGWKVKVVVVDLRNKYVCVSGQEVTTKDGIVMKISLAALYQPVDPEKAVNKVANAYEEALHIILQVNLRRVICCATAEEIISNRLILGQQITETARVSAGNLGIQLQEVDIKDIMFPGEFKKIFAETVKARHEGMALLEKARAEAAALRSLANAAAIVKGKPELLQLRLLQSSGNTLMVGVPGLLPTH